MRLKDTSKIEAIFQATLTLVKERGLAGITMGDISKAAAIGTGTLYIYFENKDELIRALFADCRLRSAQQYFAGISKEASFEERIRRLFTNIIDYKVMYFEVSAFLEQAYHSPYVCMADLRKKQKALLPLFELIREGIREKKIKDADEDLIVSYLFGIINDVVKKAYFSKKKLSSETVQRLYLMFWDGIRVIQRGS